MIAADFPELDAMIAAGWGDTSQKLIPSDWRTRRGPDGNFTDPNAMLQTFRNGGDVFGPENTWGYLEKAAAQCQGKPLAAWGKHATKIRWQYNSDLSECAWNRHQELKKFMGPLDCLRINGDGTPCHPLYLPATLTPIPLNY